MYLILFLLLNLSLSAQEANKELEPVVCDKEELLNFFPVPVVKAVLSKHDVSEEKAETIAQELSRKKKEIDQQIEKKVEESDPHLFRDLSQRDKAIRIYNETLLEILASVLKEHEITDEEKIQAISEEVRTTQSSWFYQCIRQEQTKDECRS